MKAIANEVSIASASPAALVEMNGAMKTGT